MNFVNDKKLENGVLPQNLINNSQIYYVNEQKNRTDKWLKALGLQLPSAITKYGSINSIPNSVETVKSESERGVMKQIRYTTNNFPVVVVGEDILDGVPKSKWVNTVKETIRNNFSAGIPIKGKLIKVNKTTRNEFTNSKDSKYYRGQDKTIYKDKFRSANYLDEIILASTSYINEDLNHERADNIKEFARGSVLLRIGSNDYSAKVIIGFTNAKTMVLYDVVDFQKTALQLKKADAQSAESLEVNGRRQRASTLIDPSLAQNATGVNNYSMQKNEFDSDSEEENSGIRKQERTPYRSNRSILAETMLDSAVNAQEKEKLEKYLRNVESVDRAEKQLYKVNRELKELSFGKGKRDSERLDASSPPFPHSTFGL